MKQHTGTFAGLAYSPEACALLRGNPRPMAMRLDKKDELYVEDYEALARFLKGQIKRPRGRPRENDSFGEARAATCAHLLFERGEKFEAAVELASKWYELPNGTVRRVHSCRYGRGSSK